MLIRVVKMTFKVEAIPSFLRLFNKRKKEIRAFAGCCHLELWQDRLHTNVYFTYSQWQNAEALDQYRSSPFFNETWQQTKLLFSARPEAWSVYQVSVLTKPVSLRSTKI